MKKKKKEEEKKKAIISKSLKLRALRVTSGHFREATGKQKLMVCKETDKYWQKT